MITRNVPCWQQAMREAFKDPLALLAFVEVLPSQVQLNDRPTFSCCCPRNYAQRMTKKDPDDPLLKQVLPVMAENLHHPEFVLDPTGDSAAQSQRGVLQKYHGRALVITTGSCAIHCRYCFRQHFNYRESYHFSIEQKLQALGTDIEEIILSGGDPLMLNDEKLNEICQLVISKKHLKRIRIHTRVPIVLPERITDSFLSLLEGLPLSKVMVIHCNHPNEINEEIKQVLHQLSQTGTMLLNQSVLLKGINDTAHTLIELSERLLDAKVLPYYLHLLDKVAGAVHFDVCAQQGLQLLEEMKKKLPGFLVPKLVREQAGFPYKIAIHKDV